MAKYVSPGVHTVEKDISVFNLPKNHLRRIKIGKILGIEVPNKIIITHTPKGLVNFTQIW